MKGFNFRLQTVEMVRKTKEQEALRVLGSLRQALQNIIDRKIILQDKLSAALLERESLASTVSQSNEFEVLDKFIEGTKVRIRQADQQITRATRNVEKAMRGYLHARRDCRVMEIIREKDLEDFKKEQSRRDQKIMDEIASSRSAGGREL